MGLFKNKNNDDNTPAISEGEVYTCFDCPKEGCICRASYTIPFGAVIPAKKICSNCSSGSHQGV